MFITVSVLHICLWFVCCLDWVTWNDVYLRLDCLLLGFGFGFVAADYSLRVRILVDFMSWAYWFAFYFWFWVSLLS